MDTSLQKFNKSYEESQRTGYVNSLLVSFVSFLCKLTNSTTDELCPNMKLPSSIPDADKAIQVLCSQLSDLLQRAAEIIKCSRSEVKVVGQLEPGKIYCLQVELESVNMDWIFEVCEHLRKKGIEVVVLNSSASFVSVPEGYEIVKIVKKV